MPYQRQIPFKRTLCFSLARRHYRLFKIVISASFIAISLLLFLKIQHFVETLNHSSMQKPTRIKLWNDEMYVGRKKMFGNKPAIFKPESVNRAIFTKPEYYVFNGPVKSVKNISFELNNSTPSKTFVQKIIRNTDVSDFGNIVRHPTETMSERRDKQNAGLKGKELPVFAVIIVVSRPNNVLLRLAARKTWAEDAEAYRILVRFVVGKQENWSEIVDRESTMHKDVIIYEDEDTVEVVPSKVIQGFEWALRLRPTPLYVMKIDDDTIVNLAYLTKELMKPSLFGSSQILGAIRTKAEVVRDPEHKWFVSILDYPSSTYPPYAFGGGYIMHAQAARTLLEKRYYTYSWVQLEDVYLTGLVASQAGIGHKPHRGFSSWECEKVTACDFVQDKRINSVNNTERDFYELYKGIQNLLRAGNAKNCN